MWKKILLGLVVLIAVVLTIVMVMTSGMTETAESFFRNVADKQYDKAYSYLSEDFTKSVSKEELAKYMQRTGLQNYRDVSWGNRSVDGKRGEIEGTVETVSGGVIPVTVKCIKKGDGSWRIYAINKPASGVAEQTSTEKNSIVQLPSEGASVKLVKESIAQFAQAVNKKDMADFRRFTAKAFQKEVSTAKLNSAFKSFMDMETDFTVLDRMKPVIDPKPVRKENGTLHLEGYYETSPSKFYYTLVYVQEEKIWKLISINVELK